MQPVCLKVLHMYMQIKVHAESSLLEICHISSTTQHFAVNIRRHTCNTCLGMLVL